MPTLQIDVADTVYLSEPEMVVSVVTPFVEEWMEQDFCPTTTYANTVEGRAPPVDNYYFVQLEAHAS